MIFSTGVVENSGNFARKFPRNFPINLAYLALCFFGVFVDFFWIVAAQACLVGLV